MKDKLPDICPYSDLPFWCAFCPELDYLDKFDKCPLGVSPADFVDDDDED